MLRRWAMIGLVVCGLACVAGAALWVRSGFYSDNILYVRGNRAVGVFSSASRFGVTSRTTSRRVMMPGLQWIGHPLRQLPTHPGVFSGIGDFSWRRWVGTPAGGGVVHQTVISVPIWFPMIICAGIGWFCSRKGGNARLGIREEIRWLNPRLKTKIVRFAMFCAAGVVIGAIVEGLSIAISLDRGGGQLVFTGLVSILLISALLVATRRRIEWHRAVLWLMLEMVGCVCFFGATMDRIWYYFGRYRSVRPEILQGALVFGVGCYLCGAILLLFLQVTPRKAKPGPYCRGCGYCLIGAPQQICPECGRPFTIEELGVPQEALAPPPTPS